MPGASLRPAQTAVLTARSTLDPGARALPALDRLIHTEQVDVVTARADDAVSSADAVLKAHRSALEHQLAAVADDRATIAAASRAIAADRDRLSAAIRAANSARGAQREALAGMARAAQSLGMLGVDLYVGSSAGPTVTPAQAQQEAVQQAELTTLTSALESERNADARSAAGGRRRLSRAETALGRAQDALGYSTTARRSALGLLAAAEGGVGSDRRELAGALEQLRRASAQRQAAVASFDGAEGNSPDPVPTILGRPALDAGQLTGWFDQSGYSALTRAPVSELARWYIEEGDAEGVRGDLAFAQAVLETGGFSSSDAVSDNNFAGIGHCDSCAHGWKFPSARLGVRAQIQLLRTYAQPGLTAAGLADPPVIAALNPSSQSAEGCCRTWPSLTGVWATDPVYGQSILELYQDMLAWALGDRG